MRSFLRALFAILIVAELMTQLARARHTNQPSGSAESLNAGLERLGLQVTGPADSGTVVAAAASCSKPVIAASLDIFGGTAERAKDLVGQQVLPRYVYLGHVSEQLEQVTTASRWLAASLSSVVGLRTTYAPSKLILVMLPNSCPELVKLDWRTLSPRD